MIRWACPLLVVAFSSCTMAEKELSPCFQVSDLQAGDRFAGVVILEATHTGRTIMLPLACEGGGPALLPEGYSLSKTSRNGDGPSSAGAQFYRAEVQGHVINRKDGDGIAFEVSRIANVEGTWPRWLKSEYRDPY